MANNASLEGVGDDIPSDRADSAPFAMSFKTIRARTKVAFLRVVTHRDGITLHCFLKSPISDSVIKSPHCMQSKLPISVFIPSRVKSPGNSSNVESSMEPLGHQIRIRLSPNETTELEAFLSNFNEARGK